VLWARASFAALTPECWDDELCEDSDIARHIRARDLVPIFVGFDGAFAVEVRIGSTAALTERESQHICVRSRGLYVLETTDSGAWVSGLEHVGADPASGFAVSVPAGSWAVDTTLIAWDDEDGSVVADGRPSADALPDFILLVRPVEAGDAFRDEIEVFERPR
jgi:hypothetical protein